MSEQWKNEEWSQNPNLISLLLLCKQSFWHNLPSKNLFCVLINQLKTLCKTTLETMVSFIMDILRDVDTFNSPYHWTGDSWFKRQWQWSLHWKILCRVSWITYEYDLFDRSSRWRSGIISIKQLRSGGYLARYFRSAMIITEEVDPSLRSSWARGLWLRLLGPRRRSPSPSLCWALSSAKLGPWNQNTNLSSFWSY